MVLSLRTCLPRSHSSLYTTRFNTAPLPFYALPLRLDLHAHHAPLPPPTIPPAFGHSTTLRLPGRWFPPRFTYRHLAPPPYRAATHGARAATTVVLNTAWIRITHACLRYAGLRFAHLPARVHTLLLFCTYSGRLLYTYRFTTTTTRAPQHYHVHAPVFTLRTVVDAYLPVYTRYTHTTTATYTAAPAACTGVGRAYYHILHTRTAHSCHYATYAPHYYYCRLRVPLTTRLVPYVVWCWTVGYAASTACTPHRAYHTASPPPRCSGGSVPSTGFTHTWTFALPHTPPRLHHAPSVGSCCYRAPALLPRTGLPTRAQLHTTFLRPPLLRTTYHSVDVLHTFHLPRLRALPLYHHLPPAAGLITFSRFRTRLTHALTPPTLPPPTVRVLPWFIYAARWLVARGPSTLV